MRKLEIGCGRKLHEGYEGLDIGDFPIEYPKMDARKLPFKDETFDEVFAHWVLEHFAWRELPDLLKEWKRVLKKGGILHIVTNNQEAHNRCLAMGKISWEEWVKLTYGISLDGQGPVTLSDCHKIGFTKELLVDFFIKAGFEIREIEAQWECREDDGSIKCPGLIIKGIK